MKYKIVGYLFIEGLKMSFADLKPIYVSSWEEAHNFL